MPGPVVHHIVAEKAFARLRGRHHLDLADPRVRAGLLLGAQGPDVLFFNVNDWPVVGSTVADAVGTWFGFLDTVEEVKSGLIAPLKELDQELERGSATYAQLRKSVVALKGVADTLGATVNAALESLVVGRFASEVFDKVVGHPSQQPGMTDYTKPGAWWAFDMLHYRHSGQFTRTLFKRATTPAQRAYALGYATHYAADVVLHPFINMIAGGPYRTHGQRHKVIETNQDVLAFNQHQGRGELGASKLFEQYIFDARAEPSSIGSINFKRRKVDESVKKLLVASVSEVYQGAGVTPSFGRPLKEEHVDTAFSLWLRWFEHSTTFLEDITPPRGVNLSQELADIWADAQAKVAAAWAAVGAPGPGHGGIRGFFEAVAAAILVAFEVAEALLESAAAVIDAAVASGLAIADSGIRDLLLMIQQLAYSELFLRFHHVLVLQGLAYPTTEQADFPQTHHMRSPSERDPRGRSAPDYLRALYPLKAFRPAGMENEAHLIYPFSGDCELPRCFAGPDSYVGRASHELIEGYQQRTSADVYGRCAALGLTAYLSEPVDVARDASLGSAVPFSEYVYGRLEQGLELNDFDLDGDRGFGHPSWRVFDPGAKASDAQPLVIDGGLNTDGSISPRHVKRV